MKRIALAAAAVLVPGVAAACPVCFSAANPQVLETYYFTVSLMTFLPFAMIGGLVVWLRRRARENDA
jgi:hypothetical protein